HEEAQEALKPNLSQREFSILLFDDSKELIYEPNASPGLDITLVKPEFLEEALRGGVVTDGGRMDGVLSYHIASRIQLPLLDSEKESGIMVMVFHDLDH
ncbi:hypothetical protein, partial [Pseudomonas sp. 2822-17]|uniref:hypothetical protein n=1 Tax=Pseudomonas sp. 2822-17 TaxID=1712678 RepID=UPI000C65BF5A